MISALDDTSLFPSIPPPPSPTLSISFSLRSQLHRLRLSHDHQRTSRRRDCHRSVCAFCRRFALDLDVSPFADFALRLLQLFASIGGFLFGVSLVFSSLPLSPSSAEASSRADFFPPSDSFFSTTCMYQSVDFQNTTSSAEPLSLSQRSDRRHFADARVNICLPLFLFPFNLPPLKLQLTASRFPFFSPRS